MTRTITLKESTSFDQRTTLWTVEVHTQGQGSVEAGYFFAAEGALEWALKQT